MRICGGAENFIAALRRIAAAGKAHRRAEKRCRLVLEIAEVGEIHWRVRLEKFECQWPLEREDVRVIILLDFNVILGRERKDRCFKRSRTMR